MTIREAAVLDADAVCRSLQSDRRGLTREQAHERLQRLGPNSLGERRVSFAAVLLRQVRNPLLVLLVATAVVSAVLHETTDAYLILAIVALSVGLGFVDEYRSERAMADLHRRVRHRAVVRRDGSECDVDVSELVAGDVVVLSVGDVVPADIRLLDAEGLACGESVLTGESLPSEKSATPVRDESAALTSCAFMGTTVEAGRASGIVVATGLATEFGRIAAHLAARPPETAFQIGLRRFSAMLVAVTLVLTASIFVVNAALHHPLFESLLFSLAIAVGLTPQLLPAIVTVSLATGAARLAQRHVIVKRLVSIEDLGNVEILFTDKTGTLTEGTIAYARAVDVAGAESADVFELGLACCDLAVSNAAPVGGNQLDRALWTEALRRDPSRVPPPHLAVLAFDHDRKMISVVVDGADGRKLITKGAPEAVLAKCDGVDPHAREVLQSLFASGARVVGVATRSLPDASSYTRADERNLRLAGFLVFSDPLKSSARQSLDRLAHLGIDVRIITGDNEAVAAHACAQLRMPVRGTLTGARIASMTDAELQSELAATTIFARVTPDQKSRIIRLQRALGRDVGFLGDGVNDAVALHYADVGISVDSASDVAKDAADIILLDKDLAVLADGVMEGRRIFSNTIKYVLMGTSSNFGNMFSAAGASLFLPFLPMTAPQILLNNVLYDVSEMTIPTDNVDDEMLHRPSHWDLGFIRRFMLVFGPISSIFDYMTFAVMLAVFHAHAGLFQSGWFVESLATQSLIIFVIRTRRIPFVRSRPSVPLLATTVTIVLVAAALPFTPVARWFGFVPLPPLFFALLLAMIVVYLALVEAAKALFFRALRRAPVPPKAERRLRRIASRWID